MGCKRIHPLGEIKRKDHGTASSLRVISACSISLGAVLADRRTGGTDLVTGTVF